MLEEIRGYLSKYKGRFGIGTCTYGQPLSVFVNEESNIRQIEYALAADRKYFGVAPDVYLMSEHAMHAQIPQLLKGFGFRGAIMRTHYMMYGYNPCFDVPIGWWIGLDGSRVATVPTYKGEGAQFGKTTVDNWILTRYPGKDARSRRPISARNSAVSSRCWPAAPMTPASGRRNSSKSAKGKPGFQWILLEELLPLFPAPQEELRTGARMTSWCACPGAIAATRSGTCPVGPRWASLRRNGSPRWRLWRARTAARATWIEPGRACSWPSTTTSRFVDCSRMPANSCRRRSVRRRTSPRNHCERIASRMASGGFPQVVIFNPVSWRRQSWIEIPVAFEKGFARGLEVRHEGKIVPSVILSADSYSDGNSARSQAGDSGGFGWAQCGSL